MLDADVPQLVEKKLTAQVRPRSLSPEMAKRLQKTAFRWRAYNAQEMNAQNGAGLWSYLGNIISLGLLAAKRSQGQGGCWIAMFRSWILGLEMFSFFEAIQHPWDSAPK